MIMLALYILLFIGFFALIYFMADVFIDNLKEICHKFEISPLIIGLLVIGIDLEELVASVFASINGLPYIAIGNVIGNSIISLTIGFGFPALIFKLNFEKVSIFYPILMVIMGSSILIGILVPFGLFYAGLFNISMFTYYLVRNLMKFKSTKDVEIYIVDEEEEENGEEEETTRKNIILIVISFILIFIGGQGLVLTAEIIIRVTLIAETFFGLVIISMLTNVEEFLLIYKSIKKKEPHIGIGGMIGKVFWNFGITFGVSSIILMTISGTLILMINCVMLIGVLFIFLSVSKKRSMHVLIGSILTNLFIIYLIINFLFI